MMKRPASVSVIAWSLIVLYSISIITSTVVFNDPLAKGLMAQGFLPIPLQYVMHYVTILICIVAGIAMLKRQNWARLLYVVWSAIILMTDFVTSPMTALTHSACSPRSSIARHSIPKILCGVF
jgi:hypothetical protein